MLALSLRAAARASAARAFIGSRAIPTAIRYAQPSRTVAIRSFSHGKFLAAKDDDGSELLSDTAEADLVAALDSEIRFEEDEKEEVPEFVTEFIKSSGFKVNHPANYEQVELVKKDANGDIIRVFFSVDDAVEGVNYDDDESYDVDEAGSETGSKAPVEESKEVEEDEDEDIFGEGSAPVRLNIVIEKPSGSAIAVEGLGQDGYLSIHSVAPYADKSLALDESAEGDYKRRLLYRGPAYNSLDDGLQSAFEEYLNGKGVNEDLLQFIFEYSVYKENEQYGEWLKQVRDIIAK